MKKTLLILGVLSFTISYAQMEKRVGINTENPKVTLEIEGDPTNTTHFDGIIPPRITGDQLKAKTYGADQTGALVYVTAAATTQEGQTINVKSAGYYYFDGSIWQTTKPLVYTAGKGIAISANNEISRTGFEEITENNKTGWRLIGRDANNYGNIGTGALDASYSSEASATRGATGDYSFAVGYNATASGDKSFAGLNGTAQGKETIALGRSASALGEWSIALGYADVSSGHSIAIGNWAKSTISAERSFSFGSGNQLLGSSGNYAFGMNNKTNTGTASVFAIGQANEISAASSYAIGANNSITGYGSVAIGYQTKALGHTTFALGSGTTASAQIPIAIGRNGNMLTITENGNVGIGLGQNAATEKLDVNGNIKINGVIKLQEQTINAGETCTKGQIAFSGNIFYACDGVWKTISLNN